MNVPTMLPAALFSGMLDGVKWTSLGVSFWSMTLITNARSIDRPLVSVARTRIARVGLVSKFSGESAKILPSASTRTKPLSFEPVPGTFAKVTPSPASGSMAESWAIWILIDWFSKAFWEILIAVGASLTFDTTIAKTDSNGKPPTSVLRMRIE